LQTKACFRFAKKVALVVIVLVLPAAAGSIAYKYSEAVTGVQNETATVSLTFNPKTDKITGTIHFTGGVFGGITDNFSGTSNCTGTTCAFVLNTTVHGDNLSYTVTFSDPSGSLSLIAANGSIWHKKAEGTFDYCVAADPCSVVPEGGSAMYVLLASLSYFGAMRFRSRRQRASAA
jgi:hypothetical protein